MLVFGKYNLQGTTVGRHVPLLTFGTAASLAGGLAVLFPETLNRKLPDTISEAEYMDKIVQN